MVLLGHPVLPVGLGDRAVNREHREWHVSAIP
jgi:hypothetical protein